MISLVRCSCLVLAVVHLSVSAPSNSTWKSWKFCKEVGPDKNNQCLINAVYDANTSFIHGNSYFGIPDLDPLKIQALNISQSGENKPVAIDIAFKDISILGFSQFEFKEMKSDWKNGKVSSIVKLMTPVQFIADYKINGKILVLPIQGEGKSHIVLEDLTTYMSIDGRVVEKKKKKYLKVETMNVFLEPGLMKMNFENLFNGNKALGDNMNKFMNENWQEILKEIRQPLSQGIGEVFRQISMRVFAKIPFDTLVPK